MSRVQLHDRTESPLLSHFISLEETVMPVPEDVHACLLVELANGRAWVPFRAQVCLCLGSADKTHWGFISYIVLWVRGVKEGTGATLRVVRAPIGWAAMKLLSEPTWRDSGVLPTVTLGPSGEPDTPPTQPLSLLSLAQHGGRERPGTLDSTQPFSWAGQTNEGTLKQCDTAKMPLKRHL